MNAKLDTKKFLEALSLPAFVSGRNKVVSMFDNVYLRFKDEKCHIVGSDSSNQVTSYCEASFEEGFTVCCPSQILFGTTSKIDDEFIFLEKKEGVLIVSTKGKKRKKYKLLTVDPKHFIFMNKHKSESTVEVSGSDFKVALENATSSTDPKDIRPMMSGVCIRTENKNLILTGTDSNTLINEKILINSGELKEGILPDDYNNIIKKLNPSGFIKLSMSNNVIITESQNVKVLSRLLAGKYPNIDSFYKTISKNYIVADKAEVLAVLERISHYAISEKDKRFNGINIFISNNNMELYGENMVGHSASEELEITNNGVDDIYIRLSIRLLSRAFVCIDSEKIKICISSYKNPIYVAPENQKGIIHDCFVMPQFSQEIENANTRKEEVPTV